MSRFRLVDSLPIFAWGRACAITKAKAEAGERYLDLDFDVANDTPNGSLFVREAVVRTWAEMIGYLHPDVVVDLEAEVLALKVRNAELVDRLEAYADMRTILDAAADELSRARAEAETKQAASKAKHPSVAK